MLFGALSLGLNGCDAIRDQEFECVGFDEQRTVAQADTQHSLQARHVPQTIDFHVRQDYVLVKSFRAPRVTSADQGTRITFALQAPQASMTGTFDSGNGMLSYNESHQSTIDGQTQVTQTTGVYRCTLR